MVIECGGRIAHQIDESGDPYSEAEYKQEYAQEGDH